MWFAQRKEDLSFVAGAALRHTCAALVPAPRPLVFATVTDPDTWTSWFPNVRAARYASPPPYGVGTIREAHVGGTHWVEELIAWETPVRWAYTVTRSSVPLAHAQIEVFDFEDAGGDTRVRWTLAFEPRLLARLGAPFMPRIVDRLFQEAMRNLGVYLRHRTAVADAPTPLTQR